MGNIFPYRLRFEKTGKMRFLSHHDLMRLFERAIRRSGLPIRMTEGYNPHPILSFPTALGLGIESVDEVMEIELSCWEPPKKLEERLTGQLPDGIRIRTVEPYLRKERCFVDFVEYEVEAEGQTNGMEDRIASFFDQKEHVITRNLGKREKTVDIRPYVLAVEAEEGKILLRIRVTDTGSARPDEVLKAVGVEVREDVRIRKTYTELKLR